MTEILWIDNDCNDEYKDFVDVIEAHGYKATAVETVPEGLELLKKDMNRFSAIITDARGKTEKTGPEDLGSLKVLERELMRLWNKRYIPYYIYTGKKAVYESETFKENTKSSSGKVLRMTNSSQGLRRTLASYRKSRLSTCIRMSLMLQGKS